jgi:hypothetical protein
VSGSVGAQFQPAVALIDVTRRLNEIRLEIESKRDQPEQIRALSPRLAAIVSEMATITSDVARYPSIATIISQLVEITGTLGACRALAESGQTDELHLMIRRAVRELIDISERITKIAQKASADITNAIRRQW